MGVKIDKAALSVIRIYEDAILQELRCYREGLQTKVEMKLRSEKHKDDFYQLYRGNDSNRKIREEFDTVYNKIISNIGS